MSTTANDDTAARTLVERLLGPHGFRYAAALAAASALSAASAAAAIVGLITDPTRIVGAAAWLKPLKFAISICCYCATLAWLLTFVQTRPRAVTRIARITAAALSVELLLIGVQVMRGQASHYNVSTPLNAVIYQLMGILAVAAFGACIAAAVLVLREPDLPQPLGTGLRATLTVTVIGMAVGIIMVVRGAHTVGGPDGGPGLPLTGWSTQHGDLRIAHFVGLHALQVIPLATWLIDKHVPGSVAYHRHVVRIVAIAYTGIIALLTGQAKRGQPVSRPDAATLIAAGVWVAGCATVAVRCTVTHRWRRRST